MGISRITLCLLISITLCCCKTIFKRPCATCSNLNFSFPGRLCAKQNIVFENLSEKCSANTPFLWNYGDGTPATYSNEHTYVSPGLYTVTLFIPKKTYCSGQKLAINIKVEKCEFQCPQCEDLKFVSPSEICIGEKIVFENTSTGCNANTNFIWDFGDGTVPSADPSHTYMGTGQFTVKLLIPGSNVCKDREMTKNITVKNCHEYICKDGELICCLSCNKLNFTFPDTICRGKATTFINNSTDCPPGTSFIWDFGDNSPLSTSSTHAYTNTGSYTVKLLSNLNEAVRDTNCLADSVLKVITVVNCNLSESCNGFTVKITRQANNNNWAFTASVTGGTGLYQYTWTASSNISPFSGQSTNGIITPVPFGGLAAPYSVTVTVKDSRNCSVSDTLWYPGN
jgi:PKD repeat protein